MVALKHKIMLNRNATLFLSITAWLSCLLIIVHQLLFRAEYGKSEMSLLSWVNLLTILATYLVLGLFGLSLYNNNESTRKNTALILTIFSGIWLGLDLYFMVENPYLFEQLSGLSSLMDLLRYGILSLMTPLALLLTGIAFYGSNNDRRKKALIWLFIGGLTFLFADLTNLVLQFYMQNMENRTSSTIGGELYGTVRQILNILGLPFSVALVLFAISGYTKLDTKTVNEEVGPEDTLDKWEKIRTISVLSPMQWLGNFLLAAIPLAGSVFLIIWGSDHENRIRRNWAIMQFWAGTVGMGLNLLVVGGLLDLAENLSGVFPIMMVLFLAMIVIASILTYNYFQQLSNFEDDQNPTLGTWLGNFVIIAIPIIGIIMLIVWATDSSKELIKKWATAQLIWIGISLMMYVYFYGVYDRIQNTLPFVYMQF